jgi:hypothetical protein
MTDVIRVGDHDPEHVHRAGSTVTYRKAAELAFTRKMEATAIEMRDAVKKLTEARILFSLAQHNDHYQATIDAGRLIVHYADQVAYLAGGIKIAIENEQQDQQEFLR